MNLSLNEVEATAKKAARGAGYPWGLADEAGRATRWLHAAGLDGCATLLALLRATETVDELDRAPRPTSLGTRPACPVAMGLALSDLCAAAPENGLALGSLQSPLLILPFIASLTKDTGQALAIHGQGFHAVVAGDCAQVTTPIADHATEIRVDLAEQRPGTGKPRQTRAHPEPQTWAALLDFAARTYAPATEASRLKGAGAGLNDND